jgi:hypothetical protein
MTGAKRTALMALTLRAAPVALLAMASMPAAAVVSFPFQRVNEMRTVINLPGLATALGVPIDRIEAIGPRVYRVSAGRCHVDVRMELMPGVRMAARYVPRAGPRICER